MPEAAWAEFGGARCAGVTMPEIIGGEYEGGKSCRVCVDGIRIIEWLIHAGLL
jgi:hypothetical protein